MSRFGWPSRSSSGGGLRGRMLIGVVIAAIGLITYFTRTQVNPVTGEKQHIAMTVDQEKSLGLQAAPKMAAEMGGAIDPRSSPEAQLVADVGKRIVDRTDASKSPYVGNFNYYLLDDPKTINAFALPGGQIFITRALFDRLENEAQLAGVLGHETGHVINRHSAEHMAKGQLGQMLVTAVGVGASDRDDGGRAAAVAAMMANQMLQLRYGRKDETEADEYGLKYMAQAGYDPTAMLQVMEILKQASQGSHQPEILSSHPLPDTRLADIRQWLKEHYPKGVPSDLTTGRNLSGRRD